MRELKNGIEIVFKNVIIAKNFPVVIREAHINKPKQIKRNINSESPEWNSRSAKAKIFKMARERRQIIPKRSE